MPLDTCCSKTGCYQIERCCVSWVKDGQGRSSQLILPASQFIKRWTLYNKAQISDGFSVAWKYCDKGLAVSLGRVYGSIKLISMRLQGRFWLVIRNGAGPMGYTWRLKRRLKELVLPFTHMFAYQVCLSGTSPAYLKGDPAYTLHSNRMFSKASFIMWGKKRRVVYLSAVIGKPFA